MAIYNRVCKFCNKSFKIELSPKRFELGRGRFCSVKCVRASKRKVIKCKACVKEFICKRSDKLEFCCRPCFYEFNRGKNTYNWKGGRTTRDGYALVQAHDHPRVSRGYVKEHILVAENALGRFLTKEEVIHHINEARSDNRVENLYLFPSNSAHTSYHNDLRFGKINYCIYKSNLI